MCKTGIGWRVPSLLSILLQISVNFAISKEFWEKRALEDCRRRWFFPFLFARGYFLSQEQKLKTAEGEKTCIYREVFLEIIGTTSPEKVPQNRCINLQMHHLKAKCWARGSHKSCAWYFRAHLKKIVLTISTVVKKLECFMISSVIPWTWKWQPGFWYMKRTHCRQKAKS